MAVTKLESGDILLLLLYSKGVKDSINEPIIGRTRLTKTIFIFNKEFYKDFSKDNQLLPFDELPEFFPWKFGPMSKDVLEDLEFFIKINFIAVEEIANSLAYEEAQEYSFLMEDVSLANENEKEYVEEMYYLTDLGMKYIESELLPCLSMSQLRIIEELKKNFNKASLKQILQYVYEKYPDFIEKSLIKDAVLKKR